MAKGGTYTATIRIDGEITAAARRAIAYVRSIASQTRQARGSAASPRTGATAAAAAGASATFARRPARQNQAGAEQREADRLAAYWRGQAEKSRAVRERAEARATAAAVRSARQQALAADKATSAKVRAAQRAEAAARRSADNEARVADRLAAHWRRVAERCRAVRERAEVQATRAAERETARRIRLADREAAAKGRAADRARLSAERAAARHRREAGRRRGNGAFGADGAVDRMARLNQSAELVGRAGRLIAAPFASAAGVTVDFEDQMTRVGALSEATGAQLSALTEEAKRLGATTRFSATQAGEGFESLAQAGFKPEQQIAAMEGVLKLAAAGNTSIAETADIAAASLGGFGYEATEMGRVADVLAKASSESKIDLLGLGETMKYVAPIAKTAGSNIEVAAAAAGLLGNAGIENSQAGTSIRAMFTRLAAPPKKARSALEMLGIDTIDAKGDLKPFESLMREIGESITKKGLGKGQKLSVLNAIFGQEALSGAAELVERAGAGELDVWIAKMRAAGGTADTLAAKMSQSARGAVEEMSGAYESLQLEIGEAMIPTIKALAVEIGASARGFGAWAKGNKDDLLALAEAFRVTASVALESIGLIGKSIAGAGRLGEMLGLELSEGNIGAHADVLIGGLTGDDEQKRRGLRMLEHNKRMKDATVAGSRYSWDEQKTLADQGKPSGPGKVLELPPVDIAPRPRRALARQPSAALGAPVDSLHGAAVRPRAAREAAEAPAAAVNGKIDVRIGVDQDGRVSRVSAKPKGSNPGVQISTSAGPLAAGGWGG